MRGADLDADADADAMQVDGDATRSGLDDPAPAGSGEGTSAGWTIRGIVKKKIGFSKRPMPVMANKLQASN